MRFLPGVSWMQSLLRTQQYLKCPATNTFAQHETKTSLSMVCTFTLLAPFQVTFYVLCMHIGTLHWEFPTAGRGTGDRVGRTMDRLVERTFSVDEIETIFNIITISASVERFFVSGMRYFGPKCFPGKWVTLA